VLLASLETSGHALAAEKNTTSLQNTMATSSVVSLTNEDRLLLGLTPVTYNYSLERAAQMKAEDMVKNGYFDHNSPDGKQPWYWMEKAGYDFVSAGENLGIGFTSAKNLEMAWMKSPSHRAKHSQ
jgi:uncharacterized protein YkwD